MRPTTEQAEVLRQELHAWLERNHLWKGTIWRGVDECRCDLSGKRTAQFYFRIIYEDSDLSDVFEGWPEAEPARANASRLFDEFEAIVTKHGFWFERIDGVSLNIYFQDAWNDKS